MSVSYLINTACALIILAVTSLLNFFPRDRKPLNTRLAVLGLSVSAAIVSYSAWRWGYFPGAIAVVSAFAFFSWMSGLLYLSFLVDMTATHRSRKFWVAYFLPAPLAVASVLVPRPLGVILFSSVGVILTVRCSVDFLLSWVRSATDDRARRDGEWMLLVFFAYGIALGVAFAQTITAVYWIFALWHLTMHYTVNHLCIYQSLTDRENLLIVDNVFDVVVILDVNGRIMRMNRRGYQITGFPPARVTGNWIERLIIHPNLDAERRREWLADYAWVDTGRESSRRTPSIDASIATKTGEEIPIDMRIVCVVNLSGEKTGYVVSASDMRITRQLMKEISDREYAARDLALSESKFSRMFIFNPTGILIIDLESMLITDANPAAEDIFARDSASLVGKSLNETGLEMSELPYVIFLDRLRTEGTVPEFSATIRIDDDTTRLARLSAVSFELNRTRQVLLSVADVTQAEELREALLRKQKMETVGILAGGIAHDFNNILAVILGHIGLAKMKIVDPLARAPVEKAESACIRAREMTGQLLAFSRGGQPVLSSCDTRSLVTEASMLACAETSVACLFDFPQDLWPLMVDRIQVGQIVNNLVRNGVDAMNGSGIITIRAVNVDLTNVSEAKRPLGPESTRVKPRAYVEIRIQDQGKGIPETIKKKIFDPFFTTKKKGTGLGLSIVFSTVQNHGGAISVGSGSDGGAVFTVYLPADYPPAEAAAPVADIEAAVAGTADADAGTAGAGPAATTVVAESPPAAADVPSETVPAALPGRKRVLLMDDDGAVRDSAEGLLSSLGYSVVSAREGSSAVALYRESLAGAEPFAFCILDLIVPNGMNGTRCAEEILSIDPDAVLLVSSGYSEDPALSKWKEYGFRGVLPKPYTREELAKCLSAMLAP